jgi:hypothetical protein
MKSWRCGSWVGRIASTSTPWTRWARRTSAAHCAGSVPSRRTRSGLQLRRRLRPRSFARLAELWAVVANVYLVTLLRSGRSTVVEGHDTQCVSRTRWLGCVPKGQQKPGLLIGSLSPAAETARGDRPWPPGAPRPPRARSGGPKAGDDERARRPHQEEARHGSAPLTMAARVIARAFASSVGH